MYSLVEPPIYEHPLFINVIYRAYVVVATPDGLEETEEEVCIKQYRKAMINVLDPLGENPVRV